MTDNSTGLQTSKKRSLASKLFQRRSCVVPTWRGLFVILLAAAMAIGIAFRGLYSFLAVTKPVSAGLLVVEGWMPDYGFEAAIGIFRQGHYQQLLVTGGPLEEGAPLSEYKTVAEFGAAVITQLGMETNLVQAVPAPKVIQDRTFASALALKQWLVAHDMLPKNINVISIGPHARRTRLIYEKAFGANTQIGIIALPDQDYEGRRWWTSSKGFRNTTGELIAYIYARFFFRSPQS